MPKTNTPESSARDERINRLIDDLARFPDCREMLAPVISPAGGWSPPNTDEDRNRATHEALREENPLDAARVVLRRYPECEQLGKYEDPADLTMVLLDLLSRVPPSDRSKLQPEVIALWHLADPPRGMLDDLFCALEPLVDEEWFVQELTDQLCGRRRSQDTARRQTAAMLLGASSLPSALAALTRRRGLDRGKAKKPWRGAVSTAWSQVRRALADKGMGGSEIDALSR